MAVPDDDPIETIDELLLDHVPPPVASLNVEVAPTQILVVPVIAPTEELTVIPNVVEHPVPNV